MGGKNNKWTQDIIFGKHLKKRQLDAQFIFSIFRQTALHVSGISIADHQEVQTYGYNKWYLLVLLDDFLVVLAPGQQTVPSDDGLKISPKHIEVNLMYIGPCIIVIVEE